MSSTARRSRVLTSLLCGATGIAALTLVGATPASAATATGSQTFNVTSYGAVGDGTTDNTAAFAAAIHAAEHAGGGTVYVPSGTYAFTENVGKLPSINVKDLSTVNLVGAGEGSTSLVEHVPSQKLIIFNSTGGSVQDLTIDARTYGGGSALNVASSYTTVAHDQILGATMDARIGSDSHSPFALFFWGGPGATMADPVYNVGNVVNDVSIVDGVNNDGFSFSFQKDGTISNITHYGSRLALYVDSNVTVDNYNFTPNPACGEAATGFFITAPSDHITIDNFTTAGTGGYIGSNLGKYQLNDISISNEKFTAPSGNVMEVGNVNGLTISGTDLSSGNMLVFDPISSATGVVIQNSTVPHIELRAAAQGKPYSEVSMSLLDDQFPAYQSGSDPAPTLYQTKSAGPATVDINGGTWDNQAGGLVSGTGVNLDVTDLSGYTG